MIVMRSIDPGVSEARLLLCLERIGDIGEAFASGIFRSRAVLRTVASASAGGGRIRPRL